MGLLVSDIIKMAEKQLSDAGIINAKGEAEQIYCHIKKLDRAKFFMRWSKEAGENEMEVYFDLIAQRTKRKPMQQILGETEFMGLPFKVRENVLIPRMDTEALVEQSLPLIDNRNSILDLCCGSGIIGISMAVYGGKEKKNLKVTAVDISDDAINLTKENAEINNIKLEIVKSDLFENLKKKKFNMILSNPPYIKSDVIPNLDIEVREYDPLLALDGGESGLVFYEKIVEEAPEHLKKKGWLIFEIGHDQGEEVAELMKQTGKFSNIEITKDLAGNDRVVKGQFEK